MIIREALARGRVFVVASVFQASYLILLVAALLFNETIVTRIAAMHTMLAWLGLGAIFWFSFLSLRTALRSGPKSYGSGEAREPMAVCLRRSMAVAWLNPLMYIELLIIPAAFAGTFRDPVPRLDFFLGLIVMSAACCYGYAIGGGICAMLFRHQRVLQLFDLASGLLLAALGVTMATGLVLGSA
jgi:arginine exporter protein ArgO